MDISTGAQALREHGQELVPVELEVRVARTLVDFQKVACIRATVFMGEQACPFDEEFDGNDLCGTHLVAYWRGEPAATVRLRWFADFFKVERVCILERFRGCAILPGLMAHAFELASRKGYQKGIGHIQARLQRMWLRLVHCRIVEPAGEFTFSGYDYRLVEFEVCTHPEALKPSTPPNVINRPEGDWDRPGILDEADSREPMGEAA